jgi:hypothetical protein
VIGYYSSLSKCEGLLKRKTLLGSALEVVLQESQ